MKTKRNLIIITAVYISITIVLMILGVIGDRNEENIKYALGHFSAAEIDTGKSYFIYKSVPYTIDTMLEFIFLLVVSIKGYHGLYIDWLSKKIKSGTAVTFISFVSLFICLNIIEFPFAYFASFLAGRQFGILNADFCTWAGRYMSSTAIFILIAGCSLTIIAIIINRTKRYIIYIPIAMFMISMCVIELYPKLIIPLFYKMEPLPAGELKNKIETMCKRADIDIDGIYMIDSGRISNAVNARMIGFGSRRKIVINDTLINIKNNDEILAIIGHEMCHYVEEHMLKGISIALLSLFLFIPLLKLLTAASAAGDIKFLAAPQRHSILLLLLIFLLFLSDPVKNAISRHFEKRADEFSINITGHPKAFIGIKKKTAVTNKSLILPNKVYTWYYYTHPAVLDRIRYAESRLKEVNRGRSADL